MKTITASPSIGTTASAAPIPSPFWTTTDAFHHDPKHGLQSLRWLGDRLDPATALLGDLLSEASTGPAGGFSTKAAWLQWRARWRAGYAALTAALRATKRIARNPHAPEGERGSAQGDLGRLRHIARTMMELRAVARRAATSDRLARAAEAAFSALCH